MQKNSRLKQKAAPSISTLKKCSDSRLMDMIKSGAPGAIEASTLYQERLFQRAMREIETNLREKVLPILRQRELLGALSRLNAQ
jgi:hypothetical protein